jgi:hypothetical protein
MLLAFVTPVLKTPCTLISAPLSIAIKNPTIQTPPENHLCNQLSLQ